MCKRKQNSRIVVQNIEDDLYCSQLNTSHCFKNFLFAFLSQIIQLRSESWFLQVVLIVPSVLVCCSYYGWHLKWIVEHASDREAEGNDSRTSQWTTGFQSTLQTFTSNTLKNRIEATWSLRATVYGTAEHNMPENVRLRGTKNISWYFDLKIC